MPNVREIWSNLKGTSIILVSSESEDVVQPAMVPAIPAHPKKTGWDRKGNISQCAIASR